MIDAISPLSTAASLASQLKSTSDIELTKPAAETSAVPGASFADYMKDLGNTFETNLKDAEKKSSDGILGKASVREVVESVMTANQTLQTAMAFRDKIVSAYLDVVKMPI